MSWILAALIPGMLMVSTVAMQRLESVMHGDGPHAGSLAADPEKAARTAPETAARSQLSVPDPLLDEPGLPTRPSRLLQPSGIANRV